MKSSKIINNLFIFLIILTLVSLFVSVFILLNSPTWLVVLSIVYIVNLITNLIILIQDRNSDAKLSWFFILTFLPVIAHIIYFIFGQKYKNRIPKNIYDKKIKKVFQYQNKENIENINIDENIKNLIKKQIFLTKKSLQKANVKFISKTYKVYDYIFDDIAKAKKFIHIHIYIIKTGEIFEKFRELITIKINEGVEVRLIADDFGTWGIPKNELKYFEKIGVKIFIFGKVYFPFIGSNNGYRTHRKLIIIDGKILHTGGVNLSDEYVGYSKLFGYWMDLNLRITGNFVQQYSLLFIYDWLCFKKEFLDINKYAPLIPAKENNTKIMLVEDSPENEESILENSLISWIENAKNIIKLSTPYLIPTSRLFLSLKNALMSGIKLEIFIPGLPDKKYIHSSTFYFAKKLASLGANIYILNNTFLHSKFGLFDKNLAYVGSMNIDTRSLYSQYETANLFIEEYAINSIDDIFKNYKKNSIKLKNIKINRWKKFWIKIYSKLFSPLM